MISVKPLSVAFPLFLGVASVFLASSVYAASSSGSPPPRLLKKSAKSSKSATCDGVHFTDIFVFGDSLSDQGNLASVAAQYPARAATNGNFTVEYVANHFGLDLAMSNHLAALAAGDLELITGNNYAVATAEGAPGPALNTPSQVGAFLMKHPDGAPAEALYVVMVGSNDVLALYDAKYLEDSGKTDEELFRDGQLAARQVVEFTVQPLIAAGARRVVVAEVSLIGATPFCTIGQPEERSAFANAALAAFNAELEQALEGVEAETGTNIVMHRGASVADFERIGLQAETPCLIGLVGVPGATPAIPPLGGGATFPYIYDQECVLPGASGFLWYDELHPTDAAHSFVAEKVIDRICAEMYPDDQGKSSKSIKKGKTSKTPKGKKAI